MATDIALLWESTEKSTFAVTFDETESIHTTLTASGNVVDSWISDIIRHSHLLVGIDVEWRPSFSRYQNPAALLQLCVGHNCLIFQLLYADYIPGSLQQFLSDQSFTFVGVGIEGDVERLAEEKDLSVYNAVDIRELAVEKMGQNEMRQKGLAALAKEVMGVEVHKPSRVRMSRWDQLHLTMDQIKYACIDAFLSFEIGRRLYDGVF